MRALSGRPLVSRARQLTGRGGRVGDSVRPEPRAEVARELRLPDDLKPAQFVLSLIHVQDCLDGAIGRPRGAVRAAG
jgi:hypothetical protein